MTTSASTSGKVKRRFIDGAVVSNYGIDILRQADHIEAWHPGSAVAHAMRRIGQALVAMNDISLIDEWLTTDEVGAVLGLTPGGVVWRIGRKLLAAEWRQGRWMVRRSELERAPICRGKRNRGKIEG